MNRMWIELDGLANLRDVGGTPTVDGGTIVPGRLLRSDNLQDLSDSDVAFLRGLGLTDVVDLRSEYEAEQEGPGPLAATEVEIHQFSLFREWREGVGEDKTEEASPDEDRPEEEHTEEDRPEVLPEAALPWVDLQPTATLDNEVAGHYMSYVLDRPDSILAALRVIAYADGASLVHCAAGKDRTGTVVALALSLVGAEREAVIADYTASSERMEAILERLLSSETYAENLRDRPLHTHLSHEETMVAFLGHLDEAYGGVKQLAAQIGWTEADQQRLHAKLRG